MIKAKKILFITQEMTPYVPETALAELGRKLPQAIQEKSREIRTFMPKWGIINERRNQLHEVIRLSGMNLIIDDSDHPLIIKVASIPAARMQVYFIDNDDYFTHRKMAWDENDVEYSDNVERAAFYARGVLETVKKLRWAPDVIHCQGWMSSIIPFYIRKAYNEDPSFRECRVVYTPSGENLKQSLPENFEGILKYKNVDFTTALKGISETNDMQLLNRLGIKYSDGVTLVEKDSTLEDYVKGTGKPFLEMQKPENFGSAYTSFFDEIWGLGKEDREEEED